MKRNITKDEAMVLAGQIMADYYGESPRQDNIKYHWASPEERDKTLKDIDEGRGWDESRELLPLFIVDERYLCIAECGYGKDIVVDLKEKKVEVSSNGVFTEGWAFMSDYYGYPDGAFFYRVKGDNE